MIAGVGAAVVAEATAQKTDLPQTNPPRNSPLSLCLSGGGFRAALFHAGALERINELGLLSRMELITSVSGGSILNGLLAKSWTRLTKNEHGAFTNLRELVIDPLHAFCAQDLRTRLLLGSRLNPLNWPVLLKNRLAVSGNQLAQAYEEAFGLRLGDLPAPAPGVPRFVFCATNMRTGGFWQFHSGATGRMGDFYTGYCSSADVKLSEAIAASSAFPQAIGMLRLTLAKDCEFTRTDGFGRERAISQKRREEHYRAGDPILLSDGGVYDNLGVEPIWDDRSKVVLVSDGGRPFTSQPSENQGIVHRLARAASISSEQVGAVRKRWLINEFDRTVRPGTYWGIDTIYSDYKISDAQGYGDDARTLLYSVRTDLDAFSEGERRALHNHGYSLSDAAIRFKEEQITIAINSPFQWPYPDWVDEAKVGHALKDSSKRGILGDVVRVVRRP